MAQAVMASWETHPSNPRVVLFAVTDPSWRERMNDAKWLDAFAVGNHGQADSSHHLCCEQRYQHRDGFRMVEVATNIFGYCVRDTMNDGDGVLFGGRAYKGATHEEAVEWARKWHAERPTHREVLRGFCWDSRANKEREVFP